MAVKHTSEYTATFNASSRVLTDEWEVMPAVEKWKLMKNRLLLNLSFRGSDEDEDRFVDVFFKWLNENCRSRYYLAGRKGFDSMRCTIIYFENADEMLACHLRFHNVPTTLEWTTWR